MRYFQRLLLVLVSLLGFRAGAASILVSEDAFSNKGALSGVGNSAPLLVVNASSRAYFFFDLGEVKPGRPLVSARLRFFFAGVTSAGSGLGVFAASGPWAEAKVETVTAPLPARTAAATIPVMDVFAKSFASVDVTALVQGWLNDAKTNNGLVVAPLGTTNLASVTIPSKEGIANGVPAILDLEFGESAQVIGDRAMERVRSTGGLDEIWKGIGSRVNTAVSEVLKGGGLKPVITVAPAGAGPAMSVGATSPTGNLSYQWFRDGAAIPGAVGANFDAQGAGGKYFVRVSNGVSSVDSAAVEPPSSELKALELSGVTLSPAFAPNVTAYTAVVRNGVSGFTVSATAGQTGAVLAARLNGAATWSPLVSGQASGSLALAAGNNVVEVRVTAKDTKTVRVYAVAVQRMDGVDAGAVWNTLRGDAFKPVITTAPAATGTALTVAATTPTGTLSYQWYRDGAVIPGAMGATYDAQGFGGQYFVRVSNGLNSVDSAAVEPPSSELKALGLSGVTLSPAFAPNVTAYTAVVRNGVSAFTVSATAGQTGAVLAARLNGAATWSPLVSGQASGSLALAAGNNVVEVRVTAKDTKTVRVYTVAVQRMDGVDAGAVWNTLRGDAFKPVITTAPAATGTALTVAATTPTGTLSYQWYRDGAAIPGATSASYDALGVGGKYFVRVSNGLNSVDTSVVEPPSSELKVLQLSGVTLSPLFAPGVIGYTGAVGYGVESIKVTATVAQEGAVLAARVNGSASWSALVSGQAGGNLPLVVGNNSVEVRVTAKDSKTVRVYTVSVQRLDSSTLLAGGAGLPSGDVWNAMLENYLKPKVTKQPAVAAGGVRVESASPVGKLTYQWYQDGSAITGQTNQMLDPISVSAAARSLKCRISNGLVEVDSVAWSTSLSERRGLVPVSGGTLPEASLLAGQVVQDFLVGKYEVTWGEWKDVRAWATGNGYDIGSVGQGSADDHPVRSVTWYEALKWCNARSEMEGLVPVYQVDGAVYRTGSIVPTSLVAADGYRLPLEREWEWAARGGVSSSGYTYSGGNVATEVGWFATNSVNSPIPLWTSGGNVDMGTWPVGKKAGNELGLYDMSGNIREWCWDAAGGERRLRGGVWAYGPELMAVGDQDKAPADYRNDFQGFRVAANANLVVVDGGKLPESSGLSGQVVIGFQIGRYEVTWAEWKAVRSWASGKGYDIGSAGQGSADGHPVRNVTWYEVLKWCNARSEMEGLTPVYLVSGAVYRSGESAPSVRSTANGYRLPLEAEWEWAAMGGASSKGYTYSGGNTVSEVAWHEGNSGGAAVALNSTRGTWPVGSKTANELGIFDMSGNVWEFCWDTGKRLRGGSWNDPAYREESKDRGYEDFATAEPNIGFRVARNRNFGFGAMVEVIGGALPESSGLAGEAVALFLIGKYEVTWGEWKAVRELAVGKGYDLVGVGDGSADDDPVRNVNWYDVLKWCNARSEMEGLTPVYQSGGSVYRSGESVPEVTAVANGYRLLLEKEWEWAARGGKSSNGFTYSGSNDLNEVGWYDANSGGGTNPVGRKKENELGLYDMSGNVWEWCWDANGSWNRRLRGGGWNFNADSAQVAARLDGDNPGFRFHYYGFRLARSSGQ